MSIADVFVDHVARRGTWRERLGLPVKLERRLTSSFIMQLQPVQIRSSGDD